VLRAALVSFSGLVVPGVGWIIGLVLVWKRASWYTPVQRWLAVLCPPGGLGALWLVSSLSDEYHGCVGVNGRTLHCVSGGNMLPPYAAIALLLLIVASSVVTFVVLLNERSRVMVDIKG